MFNDVLNVREMDKKRKRALAQVAAKLLANGQRAAGMANLARPGGGLGRQNAARYRPLTMSGRGMFNAPGPGGPGDFGQAIGRFGLVERQPGANDPGAIPGLGGIDATPSLGGGQGGPSGPPSAGSAGFGTPDPSQIAQAQARPGDPEAQRFAQGLSDVDPFNVQASQPAPSPLGDINANSTGYVNYQGTMIPVGLYKALMMDRMG